MENLIACLFIAGLLYVTYKLALSATQQEEPEEEVNDFDLLTVTEKVKVAKETSADIEQMEQMLTDLDLCNDYAPQIIRIEWQSVDGTNHAYDIYCDGDNTATECMRDIAERECDDLRQTLAYQCGQLAKVTRRSRNSAQNGYF